MPNELQREEPPDHETAHRRGADLHGPELAPYWLLAIIESADDAIISKTLESIITSWNKGAERIFGYTAQEAVGKPVTMLIPADHLDEEPAILARIRAGDRIEHYETVRVRKDGTPIDISLTVSPIRNAAGQIIGASKIARDISTRRQSELAQAQLANIIESADDAIISKSLDSIITGWNKGAERIFGYTAEEIIGKSVTILIPADHPDEEPAIIARLRRGERIEHYETVRIRKDGTPIDISLTVSPIRNAAGQIIGASKIARDITGLKRAERERERLHKSEREARERAEELSHLKDEFLATVSHELRTPLTAILGWAHMLRTGQSDGDSNLKAFEAIERNARSQAQLIEDLLDVSRIITGKLRIDVRPLDPGSFIDSAIEAVRPAAEAKGVRVQKIMDTGAVSVAGDPVRLQQVFWNLLTNAIKFTPRGGRVQIRLERVNSHIEIAVADTGAGITPEFLPHVFDRFRQADQKTTRRYGGLGLGLSIVRHLVELHGGTVRAESAGEGQGSTFTVLLPVAPVYQTGVEGGRVHPAARDTLPSYECADRLDGLRLLVVDDEQDTRELLKAGLGRYGAEVTAAGSAAEALEAVRAAVPDLLISDIGMPGEDGYDLIRRVRALSAEAGGRVPAIALTAYARVEDRMQALRAGYQMHVPKPVEMAELVAVAASLVRRGK
ncbi:MAG TPA: PAS domain S-box protein [Pyrinomonadaceae bacterium]